MARVKNEQDLLLKKRARRRLVGSVVLVIMAIVFLPMILEHVPEQERKEIEINMLSENVLDKPSEVIYQNMSTGNKISTSIKPNIISNTPKEVIIKSEKLTEKAGSKEDSESNSQDKELIKTSEKYVVQLGAFSDATKAKDQQRSLEANGIRKAYTEMIKNENAEVTRVRVGPFSTRDEAENEQIKIKLLGINGVVINR